MVSNFGSVIFLEGISGNRKAAFHGRKYFISHFRSVTAKPDTDVLGSEMFPSLVSWVYVLLRFCDCAIRAKFDVISFWLFKNSALFAHF